MAGCWSHTAAAASKSDSVCHVVDNGPGESGLPLKPKCRRIAPATPKTSAQGGFAAKGAASAGTGGWPQIAHDGAQKQGMWDIELKVRYLSHYDGTRAHAAPGPNPSTVGSNQPGTRAPEFVGRVSNNYHMLMWAVMHGSARGRTYLQLPKATPAGGCGPTDWTVSSHMHATGARGRYRQGRIEVTVMAMSMAHCSLRIAAYATRVGRA